MVRWDYDNEENKLHYLKMGKETNELMMKVEQDDIGRRGYDIRTEIDLDNVSRTTAKRIIRDTYKNKKYIV